MELKPILKWVGGKRQLLPEIRKYIPSKYNNYIEPFFGGGAVLFDQQPTSSIIGDINSEIMNVYNTIKETPDELIKLLKTYVNNEEDYYKIRNLDRSDDFKKLTNIERAARIIYLNRTCFNGLYRVNSKGQNNVPYGKYKNPTICDEENIKNCSKFFNDKDIIINNLDFAKTIEFAKPGDFVYLDPPYDPLTETASFVSYSKDGFSRKDQEKLKYMCDNLTKEKIKFLQSNSSTDFIKTLYKDYEIIEVDASRNIAAKTSSREKVKEILIKNY